MTVRLGGKCEDIIHQKAGRSTTEVSVFSKVSKINTIKTLEETKNRQKTHQQKQKEQTHRGR